MKEKTLYGRGCSTVGRAVASNTCDLQFESHHRQFLFTLSCMGKLKIKKRPRIAHQALARFEFESLE